MVNNSSCVNSCINPYVEYFPHTVLKHQYHLLQIQTECHHSNYIKIVLVSNLLQCFTGVNKVSSSAAYNDVQHGDHICKCSLVKYFTVAVCTTVQGVFTVQLVLLRTFKLNCWASEYRRKKFYLIFTETFLYQCFMFL
jgi:hypothetical protein